MATSTATTSLARDQSPRARSLLIGRTVRLLPRRARRATCHDHRHADVPPLLLRVRCTETRWPSFEYTGVELDTFAKPAGIPTAGIAVRHCRSTCPTNTRLLTLQRRLKAAGAKCPTWSTTASSDRWYFTDPNGIRSKRVVALDATGRTHDYRDERFFADHDPVAAVQEILETGTVRSCPYPSGLTSARRCVVRSLRGIVGTTFVHGAGPPRRQFDGVWPHDHLAGSVHGASRGWWSVDDVTAIAVAVPRISIASLGSTSPIVMLGTLAVMAATLQEVSDGRLVLGLGPVGGLEHHPMVAHSGASAGRCLVPKCDVLGRRRGGARSRSVDRFLRWSDRLPSPATTAPDRHRWLRPKMAELAGRVGDGIMCPVARISAN